MILNPIDISHDEAPSPLRDRISSSPPILGGTGGEPALSEGVPTGHQISIRTRPRMRGGI